MEEESMFTFLKKKADLGDDPIYLYLHGLVLHVYEEKFDEAYDYYERAAKKGHVLSKVRLHQLNTPPNETVSNPNLKVGYEWFIQAANEGNVYSQFMLGLFHIEGENEFLCPMTSFKWFLMAASNGHHESQLRVARMYETGSGVPKNKSLGRSWRLKASKSTSNDDQFRVDVIDICGILKEKALNGYPEDQFAAALSLQETGDDYWPEAARYYLLAADQGHAESQFKIAIAFLNGYHNSNRESNIDLFIKYAEMAANQGIVDCQLLLAEFYFREKICLTTAFSWFEQAAENNCADAQNMLGKMYCEGLGVAKDELKSIEWFKRAKENHYDSQTDPHSPLYEDSDSEKEDDELVSSLSSKDKDIHIDECSNCGKTSNLKSCSRCQLQKYCSPECQRQHWKAIGGHKKFCVSKDERKKDDDLATSRADVRRTSIICSICIEEIVMDSSSDHVMLQCRHEFHDKCFQLLCKSEFRTRCPVCRDEMNFIMVFKKGTARVLKKSILSS
jgi:TPR repeat protein